MAYTIILMRRDRTDSEPFTLSLSRPLFWLVIMLFFLLPIIGFFGSAFFVAPHYFEKEGINIARQFSKQTENFKMLDVSYKRLQLENKKLQEELFEEKEAHAKVQARVAIVESAHMESTEKFQQVQSEAAALKSQVAFYEKFVKPDTEREDMQCFNISAQEEGSGVKYSVNFMRNDQKSSEKMTRVVKMKILTGVDMIDLRSQEGNRANEERTMTLTKSTVLSGVIKTKVANEGLRILDIKAYDKKNNVTAHCWQAF